MTEIITSMSNSQVKNLAQLQARGRARSQQGLFVAEGIKMYREAPKERLAGVYVSERFIERYGWEIFEEKGAEPVVLSDRVFASVSDTKTPQGILCLIRQFSYSLPQLLGEKPLILVLENLQDPGNLGTIVRTGEGAGVTGILLSGGCVDIYNPKVIRSTMGSIYRMPFCYTENLQDSLKWLKQQGVVLCAAHLEGRCAYDGQDYGRGIAFLIGNESKGLSRETAALADVLVTIPMCGQVESLNASIAAAVLMYEASRQRRINS